LNLDISGLPFEEEARHIEPWLIRALEKEWSTDVRLKPIHTLLGEPKALWQQIRKRIPPNPIQATIEMEGRFDSGSLAYYQVGNTFQRIAPSLSRVIPTVWKKITRNAEK
jgi:hypothetical protein